MNQFTIITKDGSKWLRPVLNPSDTDQLSRFFQNAGNGFEDLPYIGSHPEGTAVYESEVREIRQHRSVRSKDVDWVDLNESISSDKFEYRTAYVDAESHDRHISDNPRYPLFSHMSSEHGLTLLDSELDEIARHSAPMTGVDYWKRRCQAAEKYIGQTPCDHDITPKQIEAHEAWQEIIEKGGAYGN